MAVTNCTTSDCRSAPAKFDASTSISSGLRANMTYHSGSVSGMVMWEEVQVDKFSIAYQAFSKSFLDLRLRDKRLMKQLLLIV